MTKIFLHFFLQKSNRHTPDGVCLLLVPLSCFGARRMSSASVRLRPSSTAATRSTPSSRHRRRSPRSPESHLRFDSKAPVKGTPNGVPFTGAADRNRTGTDFTPRDFKSLVSTYSTTTAYLIGSALYRPVAVPDECPRRRCAFVPRRPRPLARLLPSATGGSRLAPPCVYLFHHNGICNCLHAWL